MEPPPSTAPSDADAAAAIQARLADLGYWVGEPDGSYGELTTQAVLAFQKAEGLERDGIAGSETLERLAQATRPRPRTEHGDAIEIDLERQILLVVRDGRTEWVLNTSTGAADTPTPAGRFEVERQIDGMRHAPLGDLYRPKYFDGGMAIHGYPEVPAQAASHGCARVSHPAMDLLWATGSDPLGTLVWVY